MNFSSDAMADFEGLLEVNRKICKQQMAEKASPTLPTNCAVLPKLYSVHGCTCIMLPTPWLAYTICIYDRTILLTRSESTNINTVMHSRKMGYSIRLTAPASTPSSGGISVEPT